MHRKHIKIIALALIISMMSICFINSDIKNKKSLGTSPYDNRGKRWRIGYCESEPFFNFAGTFYGILKGLENLGWITVIDGIPYEKGQSDTAVMWQWLNSRNLGAYIEFVSNGYYSLALSPDDTVDKINNRLAQDKDIDLMIAMGTHAGISIATDKHNVPTLIFSTSNPVKSNIIKTEKDSGRDHVWASTDLSRYTRQLKVFYDLFQFKTLGIVYEDTVAGRTFAAVEDVERIAKEKNFKVISYHVAEPKNEKDLERYYKELQEAHKKLSTQIDAYYFTTAAFREADKTATLLREFYENKIPVFSQTGEEEVRYGALASISTANYNGIGEFGANAIAKVLNGKKPRDLEQAYVETSKIVINMEIARHVNYKVPFDVLLIADKVFEKVESHK